MVAITRHRDVTVLELAGQFDSLDTQRMSQFAETLHEQAASAEPPRLLLDLSGTNFIGSSFLEAVIMAWKRLQERSGRIALCGLTPFCREVLAAAQVDSLWTIYPTRDAALQALAAA